MSQASLVRFSAGHVLCARIPEHVLSGFLALSTHIIVIACSAVPLRIVPTDHYGPYRGSFPTHRRRSEFREVSGPDHRASSLSHLPICELTGTPLQIEQCITLVTGTFASRPFAFISAVMDETVFDYLSSFAVAVLSVAPKSGFELRLQPIPSVTSADTSKIAAIEQSVRLRRPRILKWYVFMLSMFCGPCGGLILSNSQADTSMFSFADYP